MEARQLHEQEQDDGTESLTVPMEQWPGPPRDEDQWSDDDDCGEDWKGGEPIEQGEEWKPEERRAIQYPGPEWRMWMDMMNGPEPDDDAETG